MKLISGGVCAAKGFSAAGVHCGIRKNHTKKDLALIACAVPASAAAVYTTNLVKGAPLTENIFPLKTFQMPITGCCFMVDTFVHQKSRTVKSATWNIFVLNY